MSRHSTRQKFTTEHLPTIIHLSTPGLMCSHESEHIEHFQRGGGGGVMKRFSEKRCCSPCGRAISSPCTCWQTSVQLNVQETISRPALSMTATFEHPVEGTTGTISANSVSSVSHRLWAVMNHEITMKSHNNNYNPSP